MIEDRCRVYLVGAGPGDYKLITLKAIECLKKADVVIYDRLVNQRHLDFAPESAERIYVGKECSFHSLPQDEINRMIGQKAREGKTVVRLKGGDPYVFGRGGEEAEELRREGIPFEVVPGVTSAVAVPAYAGIPVTHRDFVSSVHIITGHEKREKDVSSVDYQVLARLQGTLIFLMGLSNLANICRRLIEYGKPGDTPAAVISDGTTRAQKKVVGTLQDIEQKVRDARLLPPAVIVVGQVVSLHHRLDWFLQKPLSGKRVLITRTRAQAGALAEKIEDLGGEVYSFPTIRIAAPASYAGIDEKLHRVREYDWVVFTSVNGVEAFFARMKAIKADVRCLQGVGVAAIGSATGKALEEKGIFPDFVPGEYRAEALAAGLGTRIKAGEKVLLPSGDLARKLLAEELIKSGAVIDKVDLYRTIQGEGKAELLLEWLRRGEIDLITFTSSSTVRNFVKILGRDHLDLLAGVKIACIGPVTRAQAEELGLTVAGAAKEYHLDGLVEAILTMEKEGDGKEG